MHLGEHLPSRGRRTSRLGGVEFLGPRTDEFERHRVGELAAHEALALIVRELLAFDLREVVLERRRLPLETLAVGAQPRPPAPQHPAGRRIAGCDAVGHHLVAQRRRHLLDICPWRRCLSDDRDTY